MLGGRKARLLALHGKGTSASIMKTQIKPIAEALADVAEVHYLDGGVPCAPYQGIESMFPDQSYWAWYDQPTREALSTAYDRILGCLLAPTKPARSIWTDPVTGPTSHMPIDRCFALMTPPDTPMSGTYTSPTRHKQQADATALYNRDVSGMISCADTPWKGAWAHVKTGLETPVSLPGEVSDEEPLAFDGLICFSQGCAVSTGLLLELLSKTTPSSLPVKFVVLICGGRPFDDRLQRIEVDAVKPLGIPSVHVQGRKDPGLDESKRLSLLYADRGKRVVELDIGHHPPRRSGDVDQVVQAICATILECCSTGEVNL